MEEHSIFRRGKINEVRLDGCRGYGETLLCCMTPQVEVKLFKGNKHTLVTAFVDRPHLFCSTTTKKLFSATTKRKAPTHARRETKEKHDQRTTTNKHLGI
jgi:hypothetical protein